MSFSEPTKREVRRRAAHQCCVCEKRSIVLEVHHIHPEGEGGSDDIDNAAPLCPACHAQYGANPRMRTRIREMRDHLYASVATVVPQDLLSRIEMLEARMETTALADLDGDLFDAVDRSRRAFETTQLNAIGALGYYSQASALPGTPDLIVDVAGQQVAVEFKSSPVRPGQSVAATTAAVMADFMTSSGSSAGFIVYPAGTKPSIEAPQGVQLVDETEIGDALQALARDYESTCRDCGYFIDDTTPGPEGQSLHYFACSHPDNPPLDVEYWDSGCGEMGPGDYPAACHRRTM